MNSDKQEVVVTDIQIPFTSMVVLLVKVAVASIPALFILSVVGMLVSALFGVFFTGLGGY